MDEVKQSLAVLKQQSRNLIIGGATSSGSNGGDGGGGGGRANGGAGDGGGDGPNTVFPLQCNMNNSTISRYDSSNIWLLFMFCHVNYIT